MLEKQNGITLSAFLAFIYTVFIVVRTLIYGIDVPGYASLICVILLIGGIQLISLGVIGEYLGRIFVEVKNRPLYFIEEYSEENILEKNIVIQVENNSEIKEGTNA